MNSLYRLIFFALALISIAQLSYSQSFPQRKNLPVRTLNLSGSSQVSVAPDLCNIQITIQTKDLNSTQVAQSKQKQVSSALFKELIDNGVDKKSLTTLNLQLGPLYSYDSGKRELVGYASTQQISIITKNLDSVSALLDVISSYHAASIDQVQFTVDKPSIYLAQARVEASLDVRDKALQLCSLFNVTLGKPISITENNPNSPPSMPLYSTMRAVGMDGSSSSTISQGEIKFSYDMQVVYEILP